LLVICLGIIGFDDVTNKILAGAGLTTFIIGFALKDIGENFLAGILMAFQRPFRIGDLIQIDNIKDELLK
jgi:small-conductance mechanosensitive channel